ncbi:hypothetical protein A3D70_01120 [Candidatus Adlerbacteria bacterium RIFCSPHIGHO2_02_FULL_54_18]|uniref:DNA replication/recombination mediator RecO N-terminal domain-containing protein n=2 Tax=Candidatus Adleribacteriota TaxID=1752736 RepID=A0A1F4Y515_9BACT|nr:MAG: hypothetical protein A2949_02055 [Candidatus Adlerbacteria bacterium RIFCSPLOWO2_01_FULL_54_21b]OGC89019.1 MAG: hypothetical protein A3D70_01120 [Candidatus Adlerbacteria bacterium RIFCSPHIGHO2_02_FULL_54_18]
MHQKHITEGIVLGKHGVGEANVLVLVLTEELGLLRAKAVSARREDSKLRYGLETLSCGRYSFVQGKNGWRLTGADSVSRELLSADAVRRAAAGRVTRLLLRLVQGEEASALYATVMEGLRALVFSEHPNATEVVLVLRILSRLGYLPHTPALEPFVDGEFSVELSAKALESRALLIRTINESLQASGL